MNSVEDQMRDAFAHVVVPDVPVPAIEALQRRARRHRYNQASGALGAMATVAVCILGGMSFTSGSTSPGHLAAGPGVTRIKVHIDGVRSTSWLVAQQTLNGHAYEAASTIQGGRPCVVAAGSGSCDTFGWPYDSTAEFGQSGDGLEWEIAGRVPVSARTVTITYPGHTVTTPAVRTPTSRRERYFAAWFPPSVDRYKINPIIGVTDKNGRPVPPIGGSITAYIGRASHVAGLPRQQYQLTSGVPGWQLVGIRQNGKSCLSLVPIPGKARTPVCGTSPSTSDSARVLTEVPQPDGSIVVAGDAPANTATVELTRGGTGGLARTAQLPGDSNRVFWVTVVHGKTGSAPWLLATCAAGSNCWKVHTVTLGS